MLAVATLGAISLAQAPPSSADYYCGYQRPPWIVYWCDTVRPLTAYYTSSNARKNYNVMEEGGSLPVGIYWQIQGTSTKFGAVNGTNIVYKTYQPTTAAAVCWNRSSSTTSSANCATRD